MTRSTRESAQSNFNEGEGRFAPPLDLQHRFAAIVESVEHQKDQPACPPRRTGHPLRLATIPRLPGRPLSLYGDLENFAFLKQEFPHAAESASFAERHVFGDPRASCFHARHALEHLLKRVYKVEKALKPPKVTNLDGYISDPAFRELVPEVVWQKAEYIRQAGNVAVHGNRSPAPDKALDVVRELYHVLYWTGRTYLRKGAERLQGKTFDESLVPNVEPAPTPASVQELEALKAQRDAAAEARKEIESELEALRERLAAIKAENEGVHETHDWNEDKTRTLIIDLDLERAGWPLDREQDREYEVTGMPTESGIGYADYVLWGDDGKPLAVVEAKKTTVDPAVGQQQAKLYADCLETMHGQRPVIFYTNGYETRCGMTSPTRHVRSPGSTRRTSSRP